MALPGGPEDHGVSWLRRLLRPIYRGLPTIAQDFIDRVFDSLLPPRDEALLLEGEEIYYKSRRHIAEIAQPVLILVGTLLVAIAFVFDLPFGDRIVAALGVVFLVGGLVPALADLDGERIVKTVRSAFPWLVPALVIAVVADARWVPAVAALTWVGGRLGIRVLRWRFFRVLYLTNRRLIQTDGFISRRQATLPLSRVTDVALSYSFIGENLNFATFQVESAGQTLFRQIDFLASPEEFHRMVISLATTPRPLTGTLETVIDAGLQPRSQRNDEQSPASGDDWER